MAGLDLKLEDEVLIQRIKEGALIESWSETTMRFREMATGIILTLADSELAGASGFASMVNKAPTLDSRLELVSMMGSKMAMAKDAYAILSGLGLNTEKYFSIHSFDSRILRSTQLGFSRSTSDKRLNALLYPLESWADVSVLTYLLATMACLAMDEFARSSFMPLAKYARKALPLEKQHAAFGQACMVSLIKAKQEREVQLALDYWYERVATSAGPPRSQRNELHRHFGLKQSQNQEIGAVWQEQVQAFCQEHGLTLPAQVAV